MNAVFGQGVVSFVALDAGRGFVSVETKPFPASVTMYGPSLDVPLNYRDVADAKRAIELGIDGVIVPEPAYPQPAFQTLEEFVEFCESLEQDVAPPFVAFRRIDTDDFPPGSIRQEEEHARDITAYVGPGGVTYKASLWAGDNQPIGWGEARARHDPGVADFIDRLIEASRLCALHEKALAEEKERAALRHKFAR